MKTNAILAAAILLILAMSAPVRAGLIVERLTISALVVGVGNSPNSTTGPLTPFGLPSLVTATDAQGGLQGLSLQTKSGFFRNRVDINRGSLGDNTGIGAQSNYLLIVGTDTPDTPLVLDFDFLGATARGSAYFGFGDIFAGVSQSISTNRPTRLNQVGLDTPLSKVWNFSAEVNLAAGTWTHSYTTNDSQGIGMPALSVTPLVGLAPEGFTNSAGLEIALAPFHGTLDFGLLQPGEYFALRYQGDASARSQDAYDLGPDAYARALLIDPFSLGSTPPPQLSLRGLTLPFSTSVAPKLDLSLVGDQQARLTWPTNATGYALEFATSLPVTLWTAITNTPTVLSNQFTLEVDTVGGSKFYRLHKP
jgi:hypothetical protein